MGHAPDHDLPEVVPDTSTPQALTNLEAQYKQREMSEKDKYHVLYDTAPIIMPDGTSLEHNLHSTISPTGSTPWAKSPAGDEPDSPSASSGKLMAHAPICGLRRRTFFLLSLAALVIVAGAIGGGVGVGLAASRARKGSDTSGSSSSGDTSSSTTPATTPTVSSSTATMDSSVVQTTTFLNNQTGPVGFGFQGWSGPNYTGTMTGIFREEGFFDLGIDCQSYVWLPNATECCITFCADRHNATGWRCDARKRELSSSPFPRIYIWCDQDVLTTKANATCS